MVSITHEAGWTAGTVWTGAEKLATTGIRLPDRPARKVLLYGLQYPGTCDGQVRVLYNYKGIKYGNFQFTTPRICW